MPSLRQVFLQHNTHKRSSKKIDFVSILHPVANYRRHVAHANCHGNNDVSLHLLEYSISWRKFKRESYFVSTKCCLWDIWILNISKAATLGSSFTMHVKNLTCNIHAPLYNAFYQHFANRNRNNRRLFHFSFYNLLADAVGWRWVYSIQLRVL